MPRIGTAPARHHGAIIILHWLMAALIAFQLMLGWEMTAQDGSAYAAYQFHKSIGITILLLLIFRIAVALRFPRPAPLEDGAPAKLAVAVHVALYAFLFLAPVTGWMLVSTAELRVPTMVFGILPWPHLPLPYSLSRASELSHELAGWVGLGLIALHVAGALRHQIIVRDNGLARIAPGGAAFAAWMLAAIVGMAALGGYSLPSFLAGDKHVAAVPTSAVTAEQTLPQIAAVPLAKAPREDADPDAGPEPGDNVLEAVPDTPPPTWTIMPGGTLRFTVGADGGEIGGRFERWSAEIRMDPANPESAAIRAEIDVASVVADDGSLREMILGSDYLAAASHPTATFESTDIRNIGGNRYVARGHLRLRGKRMPQRLSFTLAGDGAERSVSGEADILRGDFAIGADGQGITLSPGVRIQLKFRARRQER